MKTPVFDFVYSRPYEITIARAMKKNFSEEDFNRGVELTKYIQTLWLEHEEKAMNLFREMYKIDITESNKEFFVSQILPNAYSRPLTIRMWWTKEEIEKNEIYQRTIIGTIIHELAHYFSYSRPKDSYFNVLLDRVFKAGFSDDRGTNVHYLVQAVELGIIGELFGEKRGNIFRDKTIERNPKNEYGISAKLLKEHNVPVNRTCLEFISNKVIK